MWTVAGWKHFPAHIWCACVVVAWSTLSTLQASVQNFSGLAAIRFFLGVFEAMYAGVPVYLSFFYPRHMVGFRQGIFISGSALANAYGGALGYAILKIKSSVPAWRIIFLIEGLPTLLMAIVAFFMLPDSIREARFLTDRQKEVGSLWVNEGQVADTKEGEHTGLRIRELKEGLKDWRSFVTGIVYFGCNVSLSASIQSSHCTATNQILPNRSLLRVSRCSFPASFPRSVPLAPFKPTGYPHRPTYSASL